MSVLTQYPFADDPHQGLLLSCTQEAWVDTFEAGWGAAVLACTGAAVVHEGPLGLLAAQKATAATQQKKWFDLPIQDTSEF